MSNTLEECELSWLEDLIGAQTIFCLYKLSADFIFYQREWSCLNFCSYPFLN